MLGELTGGRRRPLSAGPTDSLSASPSLVSSPLCYQSIPAFEGEGAAAVSTDCCWRSEFFPGKENTRRPWFVYHRGYRIRRPRRFFEAVGGDAGRVVR